MELKSFFKRISWFFLPFLILFFTELFILPIDFFAFRSWEALTVKSLDRFFYGRFYPDLHLIKTETGDLGHHTHFAIERKVEWFTDTAGSRNRKLCQDDGLDLVVGDSFVVGTGLDQSQILTERLEFKSKNCTYSFSPRGLDEAMILYGKAFGKPKTIILVKNEDFFATMKSNSNPIVFSLPSARRGSIWALKSTFLYQTLATFFDRILNLNSIQYFQNQSTISKYLGKKSYLEKTRNPNTETNSNIDMLFMYGSESISYNLDSLSEISEVLLKIQRDLKAQNINFIVVPIPRKETLYPEYLKNKFDSSFYSNLIKALNNKNINTIDLLSPFRNLYLKENKIVYQKDDSHWNSEGVLVASNLIFKKLDAFK